MGRASDDMAAKVTMRDSRSLVGSVSELRGVMRPAAGGQLMESRLIVIVGEVV
jgi:hypothetical protein